MGTYRKRPVVVEARRFEPEAEFDSRAAFVLAANDLAHWCNGILRVPLGRDHFIILTTVDGNDVALSQGNYAVRDVRGFFYPCDCEVFEQTHDLEEAVDDRASSLA
jgi:hypothetical protein